MAEECLARDVPDVHIACAADDKFVPHCAAMIDSAISHHEVGKLTIHFLHDSMIDRALLDQLAGFVVGRGAGWQAHEVCERRQSEIEPNRRFGRVAWYRVLLPELVPDLDRILYLDADTIVCRPLTELWELELEGFPVAAVVNPLYPFMDQGFLSDLGLNGDDYFNSGVLLMDLARWRSQGFTDKVLSISKVQYSQEWPDQNALNCAFRSNWLALHPKWNMQNTFFDLPPRSLPLSIGTFGLSRDEVSIVHFIGPYKPWHYRCKHRLRHRYWDHLQNTPWSGKTMEGVTFKHKLLRLLPEQFGWRLDGVVRRALTKMKWFSAY